MKGLLIALGKGRDMPSSSGEGGMSSAKRSAMRELRAALEGDDDEALAEAFGNAVSLCSDSDDYGEEDE